MRGALFLWRDYCARERIPPIAGGIVTVPARRSRTKLGLLLVTLIAVLAGLFLFDWQRKRTAERAAQSAVEPTAVPVVVARASRETVPVTIEAIGTIVADRQVLVAAEVAGRVTRIHFDSGQVVPAGAPLVQLNDGPVRRLLDRHRAAARLAQANLARATRLHGQTMSRAEYEQHVAAHAESQALVAQTQEDLALRLVRAPFDGTLGVRQVNLGQYVQAGTPIATLADLETLHVDFTVPERYRALIAAGQEVLLADDAGSGPAARGRVTSIDPLLDRDHRAAVVRATLDAPAAGRWWPGRFARVSLQLPPGPAQLTVPAVAVTASLAGESLFVIRRAEGHEQARFVPVLAGARHGDRVAVQGDGLQDGDLVVVAGQIHLRDGARVASRQAGTPELAAPHSAGVRGG